MTAVAVEDVWKYYGDYAALRGIALEAAPGSCLALIGRNGAGKTTLLRIIGGFSRPMKGQVLIHGQRPGETAARRRMGFIGHGISVYDELSAFENLTLYAPLYGLPDPRKSALQWLDRTGLERVAGRPRPRVLPRHAPAPRRRPRLPPRSRQSSCSTNPSPRSTIAPSPSSKRLLRDALAAGKTIVMSTHQLREALELATHVAMLARGKLAFTGPRTQEMVDDPGYVYARYGEG